MMGTITFTAGRLICPRIRKKLEAFKFRGEIEDFMESSGFISREFNIRLTADQSHGITSWLDSLQYDLQSLDK